MTEEEGEEGKGRRHVDAQQPCVATPRLAGEARELDVAEPPVPLSSYITNLFVSEWVMVEGGLGYVLRETTDSSTPCPNTH